MDQVLHQLEKEEQSNDLRGMLARLWRYRRLFTLLFTLVMIPILFVILLRPSFYQTSGAVIVGNLDPFYSTQSAVADKLGDPADLESQMLIAKSPRMLRLALEQPGVIEAVQDECQRSSPWSFLIRADCSKVKGGSEDLLNYVAPRYSVRAEGRSRVISIGYRSPLPDVAFVLANALIVTYLEDQRTENGPAREQAAKWLLDPSKKTNPSRDTFYKILHNKAVDIETERRSLPNPSRLVSFAEMPTGANSKMPLLAIGLAISAMLAGFVTINRYLADKVVWLLFFLFPSRWAHWLSQVKM
jgi:uncharacterized protein involved in exopolysaccharide biosynthesis